jgi:ribonuclease BN (tRNA processing enzyme)
VKLTVVGCSPAWPNPGGAQSGYLLEAPGTGRLLLDCGPGVLARLRLHDDWPLVDAIAITHFHLDHWGDLVPWVWGALAGPGATREKPELLAPPGGRERLADLAVRLGGWENMFEQVFSIREFAEGVPTDVAGFEFQALQVPHYRLEAYGFRISSDGHSLSYSGDSGPSDRLAELARDTDLFVCEATLLDGESDIRGHLTLGEAEAAFEESGAHRMLVTHRPKERPTDGLHELAYEGLEIVLEHQTVKPPSA